MPHTDPVKRKEYARRLYLRNREKMMQYSRDYRRAHLETERANKLAYYHANKARMYAGRKEWRERKKKLKQVAAKLLAQATERAQQTVRGYAGNLKPNHF